MGRWNREINRICKQVKEEAKRFDGSVNDELQRFRVRVAREIDRNIPATVSRSPAQNEAIEQKNPLSGSGDVSAAAVKNEEANRLSINPLCLKPGCGYIINHRTFEDEDLEERTGSAADVKRLKETFGNFQITAKVVEDGTTRDVARLMEEVETFDFTSYSCLILVIMSHGHECNIISAKDGTYSLHKDVLYPILRNATLVGKTKMLFVQSCKGITNLVYELDSKRPNEQPTRTPDELLQFFSCVEGYVSYVLPTGSIFIQILCEKLAHLGETEDMRIVCSAVIDAVKEEFYDMQIPMLHTNLTKPFVLGHYKTPEISNN